jgi:SNARE protein
VLPQGWGVLRTEPQFCSIRPHRDHTHPPHSPAERKPPDRAPRHGAALLGGVSRPGASCVGSSRADPGERVAKVRQLTEKMSRGRNVHRSMTVEMQDVEERDLKVYEKKVNDYARRLQRLNAELQAAKTNSEKSHLVHGASPVADPDRMNDTEMLDEAQRIQGQDLSATKRMQRQLAQTEELASETMHTMKDQTDQLTKIHGDLEEMDSTLALADAQIRQYMRKMATDKLILSFLFLIVVGIVVVIILKVTHVWGDDKVKLPESVQQGIGDRRRLLETYHL